MYVCQRQPASRRRAHAHRPRSARRDQNKLKAAVQQARQQVAMKMAQQLQVQMTEKCFTKCAGQHTPELSRGEQECLANCMDRYNDTLKVVANALAQRPGEGR